MIYHIPQFKWRRGKTLSYGLMVPGSKPASVTKYKQIKKCRFLSLQKAANTTMCSMWSINIVFGEGLKVIQLGNCSRVVNMP